MILDSNNLRFEIVTNGVGKFLTLNEAGIAWNNGMARVELGKVMLPDGTTRQMSAEEKMAIQNIADDYSSAR